VRQLDWRRAAANEIAHMAELHTRVKDTIADIRLDRDRLAALKAKLDDAELLTAIEFLDVAVVELGAVRRRLAGEE
jgi:division protein CdvB (Snf7/Vps24/ESCRT-III family)